MAALDVEGGHVLVRGWEQESGHELERAIDVLKSSGVRHVVYREVDRGDPNALPSMDTLNLLLSQQEFAVYACVDVETIDQIGGRSALEETGLTGVILSHAVDGALIC